MNNMAAAGGGNFQVPQTGVDFNPLYQEDYSQISPEVCQFVQKSFNEKLDKEIGDFMVKIQDNMNIMKKERDFAM